MIKFKPLSQDVMKLDREMKVNQDKFDRAREKFIKASKDYEESAIAFEATNWNKEATQE